MACDTPRCMLSTMAIDNSGTSYQKGTSAAPEVARRVLSSPAQAPGATGTAPVQASLTTAQGANRDLTYTARVAGTAGNSITVAYVVAGANTPLSVAVAGNAITVNVATSGASAATSTANQVLAAVRASAPASALVDVNLATGSDGTGVVAAMAATPLTGGGAAVSNAPGAQPLPKAVGAGIPIHNVYAER